jgi:hypothetical protein
VRDFGNRLANDPELAAKANRWISDGAAYAVGLPQRDRRRHLRNGGPLGRRGNLAED